MRPDMPSQPATSGQHAPRDRVELGNHRRIAHCSGAVTIAPSSAVSIGLGSRGSGSSAGQRRKRRARLAGIGVHHRQDFLDPDALLAPAPAIVIGDHRQQRVGQLGLRARGGLRASRSSRSRRRPIGDTSGFRRGSRIAALRSRRSSRPRWTFAPAFSAASPASADSRGQTGSARPTWATSPSPKKLRSRATVRSIIWSTATNMPGASSSRSEPIAEIDSRSVTPQRFSTSILAR